MRDKFFANPHLFTSVPDGCFINNILVWYHMGALLIHTCSFVCQMGAMVILNCSAGFQKSAISIQNCSVGCQKGAMLILICAIKN